VSSSSSSSPWTGSPPIRTDQGAPRAVAGPSGTAPRRSPGTSSGSAGAGRRRHAAGAHDLAALLETVADAHRPLLRPNERRAEARRLPHADRHVGMGQLGGRRRRRPRRREERAARRDRHRQPEHRPRVDGRRPGRRVPVTDLSDRPRHRPAAVPGRRCARALECLSAERAGAAVLARYGRAA
jgi:hypothetical protein